MEVVSIGSKMVLDISAISKTVTNMEKESFFTQTVQSTKVFFPTQQLFRNSIILQGNL